MMGMLWATRVIVVCILTWCGQHASYCIYIVMSRDLGNDNPELWPNHRGWFFSRLVQKDPEVFNSEGNILA